jgi:hypothetical protein
MNKFKDGAKYYVHGKENGRYDVEFVTGERVAATDAELEAIKSGKFTLASRAASTTNALGVVTHHDAKATHVIVTDDAPEPAKAAAGADKAEAAK